jgi:hypothetical protein
VKGYCYRVYGITLWVDCPIDDLVPVSGAAAADISVYLDGQEESGSIPVPASAWVERAAPLPMWTAQTSQGTYFRLRYAGAGAFAEFTFDPTGTEIWVNWGGRNRLADVVAVLLGPMLGCALRLRGVTCLHGSVVALDGRAVVLLGPKGAGKTTMALGLAQRGQLVISDDLVALVDEGSQFRVPPGYPHLRLTPQTAAALCGSYDRLRPLWSQTADRPQKRCLDLRQEDQAPEQEAAPLAALYVLEPPDPSQPRPVTTALTPPSALMTLMAHRYVDFMLDRAGHARDFERLRRLACQLPVRQVLRPEGLDRLSETADAILGDARALTREAALAR